MYAYIENRMSSNMCHLVKSVLGLVDGAGMHGGPVNIGAS